MRVRSSVGELLAATIERFEGKPAARGWRVAWRTPRPGHGRQCVSPGIIQEPADRSTALSLAALGLGEVSGANRTKHGDTLPLQLAGHELSPTVVHDVWLACGQVGRRGRPPPDSAGPGRIVRVAGEQRELRPSISVRLGDCVDDTLLQHLVELVRSRGLRAGSTRGKLTVRLAKDREADLPWPRSRCIRQRFDTVGGVEKGIAGRARVMQQGLGCRITAVDGAALLARVERQLLGGPSLDLIRTVSWDDGQADYRSGAGGATVDDRIVGICRTGDLEAPVDVGQDLAVLASD